MSLTATELETIVDEVAPDALGRRTAIDSDGFLYDLDTGEVLELADVKPTFQVDSQDSADWVLQVRSEIEGRMAGLAARKTALVAMLDSLIADQRRRLSWWEWRFAPSLTDFARSILTGRSRTAKFAWGQVAFRKSPGTSSIIDDAAAVAFVETWSPDRVKVTRTVNVTAVRAALAAAKAACPDEEIEVPFLVTSGEVENVAISTGVEVTGGKS